jgi:hypothetical protein
MLMKRIFAVLVILGVFLSACSAQANFPAIAPEDPQNEVAENTPDENTAEQVPAEVQAAAPAEEEPLGEAPEEQEQEQPLPAQASYEMIGAVHANILSVESWLAQGISEYQRQAMVGPLVELSMAPMEDLFSTYQPQSELAPYWDIAGDIHARFYPQVTAWVNGALDDDAFGSELIVLKIESNEMISQADIIANQQLGIDTNAYRPDYSLASAIVFELSGIQQAKLDTLEQLAESSPTGNLVITEINPYIYQFAGSELFSVIGLLENQGATPLEHVDVEFRFFNSAGEYLGTTSGRAATLVAEPGKVYPFSASLVTDGEEIDIREQWFSYEITTYGHLASQELSAYYREFDLALLNVSQSSSMYTVEGSLTNLGKEIVSSQQIYISAAGYDAEGNLVGVAEGRTLIERPLATGDTILFEVVFRSVSGEPVRYQFFAETILE